MEEDDGRFLARFRKEIKSVEKSAVRVKIATEATGPKCPECKEGDLVIRDWVDLGSLFPAAAFPE